MILYKPNPLIIALLSVLFLVSGQTVFADSQKKFERLLRIDLFGDDITERGVKGISIRECENLCLSNNECVAYTYIVSKSWCFLKNGVGQPQHKPDVISGVSFDTSDLTTIQQKTLAFYSEVLAGVSKNNRNSVARVIESYANECEGNSSTAPLIVSPENIIELELERGPTVTVVMADFECPESTEGDFPWTSKTGVPSYYIVGDLIYQGSQAAGVSLSGDLIITSHFGLHCERADKEIFPNIDVCYSVMHWDDYFETFVTFHGKHKLFKRDF